MPASIRGKDVGVANHSGALRDERERDVAIDEHLEGRPRDAVLRLDVRVDVGEGADSKLRRKLVTSAELVELLVKTGRYLASGRSRQRDPLCRGDAVPAADVTAGVRVEDPCIQWRQFFEERISGLAHDPTS